MRLDSKLVLGTVNFGMDYGYMRSNSQLDKASAFEIIERALAEDICYFDTAQEYGQSEEVLGSFIGSKKAAHLNVITKILAAKSDGDQVCESLKRLNIQQIYAVLFHDFKDYLKYPKTLRGLQESQRKGRLEKIGFSLYFPSDLEQLLSSNIPFEIIQIPYSIFDRRFAPYFSELKARNVEIHVRSIFLNGLFFQDPKKLSDHFNGVKGSLEELRSLSQELEIPISSVCLNFVHQHELVDRLVVGVRTIRELVMNVGALSLSSQLVSHKETLKGFACNDHTILHPHEWRVE